MDQKPHQHRVHRRLVAPLVLLYSPRLRLVEAGRTFRKVGIMPVSAGDSWVLNLAADTARDQELLVELLRRVGQVNPNQRVGTVLDDAIERLTHQKRDQRRADQMTQLREYAPPGSILQYHDNRGTVQARVVAYHETQHRVRIDVLHSGTNEVAFRTWTSVDNLDRLEEETHLNTGEHAPGT